MNRMEIDTVNSQVPKIEALSGLKEIPYAGISFLLNWNSFRSRLSLYPKLRNYLLWCIWRLFLKRTILDSQKGPCDMQLMQKAQEKVCCLEKFLFFKLIDRFSSPARFLRSPVSTSISAMYWSGKVRVTFWKGQAIGLYSGSSGYLMRQMGQGYQNQECLPLYFPSVLFPNVPIPFSHLMGFSVSFWH